MNINPPPPPIHHPAFGAGNNDLATPPHGPGVGDGAADGMVTAAGSPITTPAGSPYRNRAALVPPGAPVRRAAPLLHRSPFFNPPAEILQAVIGTLGQLAPAPVAMTGTPQVDPIRDVLARLPAVRAPVPRHRPGVAVYAPVTPVRVTENAPPAVRAVRLQTHDRVALGPNRVLLQQFDAAVDAMQRDAEAALLSPATPSVRTPGRR